ncbi:sulfotransferase family protein [Poseidonocella sp. HB161398]|uniref:tetratricopeptide repeat-containing sulfotransferase family protein n=1 Tax=Poseidonocella sp. HB161398 TaxID=2320855 RepID=UPI001108F9C1|nr:sulfotransferase family protein [Poseidonocella sp. HB161398]
MARRKKTRKTDPLAGPLARAQALRTRDLPGAVLTWGKVLERDPGNARALAALRGTTRAERKAILAACTALVRSGAAAHALALSGILGRANPGDASLAAFEARALVVLGDPEAALARLAPFLGGNADDAEIAASRGIALAFAGSHAAAIDHLAPLAAAGTADPEVLNVLGSSLAFLGQLDEARSLLLAAARDGKLAISGLYNLSRQADLSEEPGITAQIEAIFEAEASPRQSREMAAYALSRIRETQGERDAAFRYMALANALKPDAEIRRYMETIRDACSRAPAAAARIRHPAPPPPGAPRPVFILGMPRSGTTLAEQILLRHSRAISIGESTRLAEIYNTLCTGDAPIEAAAFRDAYLSALPPETAGAEVVFDKMPSNAFLCGLALAAMPEAKVIHCRRHPMASAFSAFRIRFAEGYEFSHRFDSIAEFHRLTEAAMARWSMDFPGRILSLPYEPLTEAPELWITRMAEFCGLDMEEGLADFRGSDALVKTASLRQVRKGIYRGSSEAWKLYAPYLAPLMAELIEEIARYEVEVEALIAAQSPGPVPASIIESA